MMDLTEMRGFVQFLGFSLSYSGVIFPFGCQSLSWPSDLHPVRLLAFLCGGVDAFVGLGGFFGGAGYGEFLVAEGKKGNTEVWS